MRSGVKISHLRRYSRSQHRRSSSSGWGR
jgi:hypothetical protein